MKREYWKVLPVDIDFAVSNKGRVRRIRPIKYAPTGILKGHLRKDGYTSYRLNWKSYQGHILILLAFKGPKPKGKEGCHKNGLRSDNRIRNLYWGTRSQNIADAKRHGTFTGFAGVWKSGVFTPQKLKQRGKKVWESRRFNKLFALAFELYGTYS
jgi:hypothetical protein